MAEEAAGIRTLQSLDERRGSGHRDCARSSQGSAVTRSRYGNGDRGQDFARFERGEIDALIELACGDLHFPRTTRSLFYASDRWVCISGDIIGVCSRYEKVVKVVIARRSK